MKASCLYLFIGIFLFQVYAQPSCKDIRASDGTTYDLSPLMDMGYDFIFWRETSFSLQIINCFLFIFSISFRFFKMILSFHFLFDSLCIVWSVLLLQLELTLTLTIFRFVTTCHRLVEHHPVQDPTWLECVKLGDQIRCRMDVVVDVTILQHLSLDCVTLFCLFCWLWSYKLVI